MTVTAWDDFPVHQASEWIAHPATRDRNFYDRYYFNAFDTTGDWIAVEDATRNPALGKGRRGDSSEGFANLMELFDGQGW